LRPRSRNITNSPSNVLDELALEPIAVPTFERNLVVVENEDRTHKLQAYPEAEQVRYGAGSYKLQAPNRMRERPA
jgi:hypothetical protein